MERPEPGPRRVRFPPVKTRAGGREIDEIKYAVASQIHELLTPLLQGRERRALGDRLDSAEPTLAEIGLVAVAHVSACSVRTPAISISIQIEKAVLRLVDAPGRLARPSGSTSLS